MVAIQDLPNELLILIVSFLDNVCPSQLKARLEPNLQLTDSESHPLKDLSFVSRRWRNIILPILFKHARLRLDAPTRPHWWNCPARCQRVIFRQTEQGFAYTPNDVLPISSRPMGGHLDTYHFDMLHQNPVFAKAKAPSVGSLTGALHINWQVPHFYHHLVDFLDFIVQKDLQDHVQSFIVLTSSILPITLNHSPSRAFAGLDMHYRSIAAFWKHLLTVLNPTRVSILAPPMDLGCLMNFGIQNTDVDWAFGDMEYHLVTLECLSRAGSELHDPIACSTRSGPGFHPNDKLLSLLSLRRWNHIALNEGSFLQAYGTYQYFERGPPSLIYSINGILAHNLPERERRELNAFTYTAIFPFATHLRRSAISMIEDWGIERLDLQLAPPMSSSILDDRTRVGRAQLGDCWHELQDSYLDICTSIARISQVAQGEGNADDVSINDVSGSSQTKRHQETLGLRQFVSQDASITMVREDLDEVAFPLLKEAGFEESEPGVFQR